MAEIEPFEARLATSLQHLADEVPMEVDAAGLTATIASAEAHRGLLRTTFGARPVPWSMMLRYAVVAAGLLLIAAAAAVLAPRYMAAPFDAAFHGRMSCVASTWESTTADAGVLDCVSAMPDSRLSGKVRITLGAPSTTTGSVTRSGSIELSGAEARWTGVIQLTATPNAAAFGDGWLRGSGAADGQTISVHLMSGDGLTWGVLGTVTPGG